MLNKKPEDALLQLKVYSTPHPIALQNRDDRITKTTDQWKTKHTNNLLTTTWEEYPYPSMPNEA
jgi:hypothetical protein